MQKNMYNLSLKQWSPFAGCKHDCTYCKTSFQRQLKRWAKNNCLDCYNFKPHPHPERLEQSLPRTNDNEFIFTCSSGDVAFCPTSYLRKILERVARQPSKTFLIQSKNPKTFSRVVFPDNVILGVTIETNRDDLYSGISKAPKPSQRFKEFLKIKHPLKMVTIEPVVDFDLEVMVKWIKQINPCTVWLGYDSGKNGLPEPSYKKFMSLHNRLKGMGINVILKSVKKK